jgi:hypothetical protein
MASGHDLKQLSRNPNHQNGASAGTEGNPEWGKVPKSGRFLDRPNACFDGLTID